MDYKRKLQENFRTTYYELKKTEAMLPEVRSIGNERLSSSYESLIESLRQFEWIQLNEIINII